MRRQCQRPFRVLSLAVVLAVSCGSGKPPEQPEKAADGFETSWTGHVRRTYTCDEDNCLGAVQAALRKLRLSVVDESGGMFRKSLEVESEDGTSAIVQVAPVTKTTTRVSIKVGYFLGDGDAARRIHSEIEAELAARRSEMKKKQSAWDDATPPPDASGKGDRGVR
jgi:Protein of unknown function (DUF3568)